jgi:hypothetical protein
MYHFKQDFIYDSKCVCVYVCVCVCVYVCVCVRARVIVQLILFTDFSVCVSMCDYYK